VDGIMQDKAKSKKEIIDKLRMILDNPYMEDDSIKNKELKQLQKKLIKPSSFNVISPKKKDIDSSQDENTLEPSVIIHRKKEIPAFIEEKEDKKEVVFDEVEEDLFVDEELYEIEKIDENLEEFTEIKDEVEEIEEFSEVASDDKAHEDESIDDLPEWETVESKDQVSETRIIEKDSGKTIPEWEPITNEQFKDKIPKIKEISKKEDEEKSEVSFDQINEFSEIQSIDNNIADLLKNNGYLSINDLKNVTIKDLTKIRGIKRKTAKKIKKDIEKFYENQISPEFESFDDEISDDEFENTDLKIEKKEDVKIINQKNGVFTYGEFTLYRKEIVLQSNKKRIIHFFSKNTPEDGEKVELPDGYKVKTNKKTGVPYISRKK
jgi:hypothetical protein